MVTLHLNRLIENKHNTIGELTLFENSIPLYCCSTLELPWKDNIQGISSIPPGTYDIVKHESPSLGNVFYIKNVPDRDLIYIHIGNYASGAGAKNEIRGCILVGTSIDDINHDGVPDIAYSRLAFDELWENIGDRAQITISYDSEDA
jgi:hypothetical protein